MVDIERKGITLSDWTKGISVDEYAGGSYYYAEGIQSDYRTKGFKLGKYKNITTLNTRNSGYAVAISAVNTQDIMGDMVAFTADGKIETNGAYNGWAYRDGDGDGGGALYARSNSQGYVNGFVYGSYMIGLARSQVDRIKWDFPYSRDQELLTNPSLRTPGTAWTLGTGRERTQYGALHSTGTDPITCSVTIPDEGKYRVAICIRNCYAGRVTITGVGVTMRTENKKSGRFTFNSGTLEAGTKTLTITPSSDFDGYVDIVNIHAFDADYTEENKAQITSASEHPICYWNGDLYIGSGSKIDILSLKYWDVKTKQIIDETYTIIDITQQAGNLIIWATNGTDSKQYYWNGIDAAASEIIERNSHIIKGVASTETVSYVLTVNNGVYRVWAVNGYQRSLLSASEYVNSDYIYTHNAYNKYKKFVMNGVKSNNGMDVVLDSLYIPGCRGLYRYGSEVPGLAKAWNKILWYEDKDLTSIVIGHGKYGMYMAYARDGVNNILSLSENTYNFHGFLVTNPIYWDKIGTRKSIEKLKLGYLGCKINSQSSEAYIKVYAIVDDDYFWRFNVTGVTNRPEIGDIYTVASNIKAKIISIEKTGNSDGIITLVTVEKRNQVKYGNRRITKVSGNGDSSIDSNYESDNMCLLKKITNDNGGYYSDFVFGENFIDSYIPYWHKIQFVIELYSDYNAQTPEVYELSMTADIADTTI